MDKRFPEKPVDYMDADPLNVEIQQQKSKRWKLALVAAGSAVAGAAIITEAVVAGVEFMDRPMQGLIGVLVLGGSALAMDEISDVNTNIRALTDKVDNVISRPA